VCLEERGADGLVTMQRAALLARLRAAQAAKHVSGEVDVAPGPLVPPDAGGAVEEQGRLNCDAGSLCPCYETLGGIPAFISARASHAPS
jgi:hypothetical protein